MQASEAATSPLAVYLQKCEALMCKANSQLKKTLPASKDSFELVKSLDLSCNFVGPKGLLPLLEVVRACDSLQSLSLKDNQLTNQSVQDIVEAVVKHKSLTRLDLSNNPITLAAGQSLLELVQRNTRLQFLGIQDTSIRPAMAQSIANQCARNIKLAEKERAHDWTTTAAEATAKDGTLDPDSVRALLATLPTSLKPHIFDSNPVDGFLMLCQQHGVSFQDTQFPAAIQSVQRADGKDYGVAGWRRVVDIVPEAIIFHNHQKITMDNIVSGKANESALLAGLTEIIRASTQFNPFSEMIYPKNINQSGVYSVKFFINGKWRYVLIDDLIPCDATGKPLFLSPKRGQEVWVLLLEKALAKLYGCYQALDGDFPQSSNEMSFSSCSVMTDVTGGVGINRDLNHAEFEPDKWWATLQDITAKGALCTTLCNHTEKVAKAEVGLSAGKTYIVNAAREVNGFRLVYLYNAWNDPDCDWNGEWSRISTLWQQHPDVAAALRYNPEKAARTGFWISYHLFLRYFASISICRIFESHNSVFVEGKWQDKSAGGPYFENSWSRNPHYEIKMEESGTLFIELHLRDTRFFPQAVDALAIHLVRADYFPILFEPENCVGKTAYIISDCVTFEGHLQAGNYWLIPSTYSAGKESPFMLRLFSSVQFSLVQQPIDPYWREMQVKSAWQGSGEYQSGDDNPQFELTIPAPSNIASGVNLMSRATISMSVGNDNEYSIIFFLCSPTDTGRYVGSVSENDVIAKSKFVIAKSVNLNVMLPPGKYVVVCCLQPEGSASPCNMSFWSSQTNFLVKELPLWYKRSLKGEWTNSGLYQSAERNPQYELIVKKPTRLVIRLQTMYCNDPAITFFLIDNTKNIGRRWKGHIHDASIVMQSPYVRAESVSKDIDIIEPAESYIIVPCLQPPGSKAHLTISVSSPNSADFQLSELTS